MGSSVPGRRGHARVVQRAGPCARRGRSGGALAGAARRDALAGGARPAALAITNGVFPQVGFPIREEYPPTLAAQYGAGAVPADFAETDQAKQVIDAWVQEQTRDRIEKLFDRIDPTWKLVLANAVYLKADWLVRRGVPD
ncbi:MAG: serpin family protein [Egibacteraceae bacterium]